LGDYPPAIPMKNPLNESAGGVCKLTEKPKKALRFQQGDEFGTARSNA